MTSAKDELKPCPFCGGESELKEYKPNVSGVAICKECGARSPICKNDHICGWRPKAVEAWNARTPEQAIAATLGNGALTAEDVRSFLNRNSLFDDTTWMHGRQELVFDEDDLQSMADELNATLGRGTCELTAFADVPFNVDYEIEGYDSSSGNDYATLAECSKCGAFVIIPPAYHHVLTCDGDEVYQPYRYCPNCRREVVSA